MSTTTTPTQWVIQRTRHWYGRPATRHIVSDWSTILLFNSKAAGEALVRELDAGVYYLANNESDRPDYKLRTVKSLGAGARAIARTYGEVYDANAHCSNVR